ncbi:MAG: hypothetical protein DRP81_09125, partial [Candidatus Omnitrophota bacterium]
FKAYPGEEVTISMSSETGPLIGSYQKDYIIWDGFIIIEGNCYHPDTGPVTFFYSNNCVIQNCEIRGSYVSTTDNHDGIRVAHSKNITIRNCIIHGIKGDSWNSSGIKFYKVKNTIVENCEIYDCVIGITDKEAGTNNIYRFNLIHDNDHLAISFYTHLGGPGSSGNKIISKYTL